MVVHEIRTNDQLPAVCSVTTLESRPLLLVAPIERQVRPVAKGPEDTVAAPSS